MKILSLGMIPAALTLVGCEMMNAPLDTSGSFDPLKPPGSGLSNTTTSYGPDLSPGAFVTANIPNTAFYKAKPKDGQDADKLLPLGTNMKIVSSDPNHVKVELDSGEVGYVPAVMVAATNSSTEMIPIGGAYQVYPPLPGTGALEPLPVIDPNGLPPEGAIPTIIDPDAPAPAPTAPLKIDPIPDLKPTVPEVKPGVTPEAEAPKPEAEKPEAEKPKE